MWNQELNGLGFLTAVGCHFDHESFDAFEHQLGSLHTPRDGHFLQEKNKTKKLSIKQCNVMTYAVFEKYY